jgi:ribose 1,5-bisphosphate isomerase
MGSKTLRFVNTAVNDIKLMKVRGAAAIAKYAASILHRVAEEAAAKTSEELYKILESTSKLLLESRPTAVSLPNGIRFVMNQTKETLEKKVSLNEFRREVMEAAENFTERAERAVDKIALYGAKRMEEGNTIMTHCNSSAVIAILKKAYSDGKNFKVFVTETRPRFQGRITAKQLGEIGIETHMIVDSGVRYYINEIDMVMVGADAIAANGSVVNKIGTSMIALAAHEARTRFIVAAETFKLSPETLLGEPVWIEERDSNEVISSEEINKIPFCHVHNPSFDVTPPEYIDAIITEEGIIPPQASFHLMQQIFGKLDSDELASYKTVKPIEEK